MRISEVASRSGVSARMLRYYDRLGVVRPSRRTTSGYREYAEQDVWRLLRVEGLRSLGLSLQEVQRVIDASPDAHELMPPALLGELVARTREQMQQHRELLDRLEQLAASGPGDWTEALDTVQLLKRLGSGRPEARYRAALDAASGSAPPAAPIAEALLGEDETNAAGALRWALARADAGSDADGPAGAVAALDPVLAHPDPAVRERAVRALASLDPARSEALLLRALDDPVRSVRGLAALALGRHCGAAGIQAVPVLIALVVDGSRDVDAAEALGAVAVSADPRVAERIVRAFAARVDAFDSAPEERARIAQALAELPLAVTEPLLERLAADPDRSTARIAAYVRGIAK